MKDILANQFTIEVERLQNEIIGVDEAIQKVQQNLQLLRYVSARSYYSPKNLMVLHLIWILPVKILNNLYV